MASSTFQYMQQAAGMVKMMLHAEPLEASALELETLNADILEDGPKFRYESPQRPIRHICFGLARRRSPN